MNAGFYSNEDDGEVLEVIHNDSFIARQRGASAAPEVVTSRYNQSTNLSRSIGDRWGPRSVVAVPDVTAITIHSDQFARFVLCSDGVCSVLTPEEMRRLAFSSISAEETSLLISEHARSRRISRRLTNDDISVIVVDVNPDHFPVSEIRCCLIS